MVFRGGLGVSSWECGAVAKVSAGAGLPLETPKVVEASNYVQSCSAIVSEGVQRHEGEQKHWDPITAARGNVRGVQEAMRQCGIVAFRALTLFPWFHLPGVAPQHRRLGDLGPSSAASAAPAAASAAGEERPPKRAADARRRALWAARPGHCR